MTEETRGEDTIPGVYDELIKKLKEVGNRKTDLVFHEPERFDINDPAQANKMLEFLDLHGYVVIANVASTQEVSDAKDNFWKFWEANTDFDGRGIKRNDCRTWNKWIGQPDTGILFTSGGATHSDFNWNTRLLPGVRKTFAKLWGDNDLLVSFDGANAFRPWKLNPSWITGGGWYHVDQNSLIGPSRQGKVCVQGLITYYDVTPDSGGFCAIPGSHRLHDSVCARAPGAKHMMDFVPLSETDPVLDAGHRNLGVGQCEPTANLSEEDKLLSQVGQPIMVGAKAGDLIIWDSRTVHCNSPALTAPKFFVEQAVTKAVNPTTVSEESPNDESTVQGTAVLESKCIEGEAEGQAPRNPSSHIAPSYTTPVTLKSPEPVMAELIRLVAYVCMLPRSHADTAVIQGRKEAFQARYPTTHWPTQKVPEGLCNTVAPEDLQNPGECPREMLELVGYTDDDGMW